MSFRYSPSTRGFYHDDQEAPTDAIPVSDEDYAALMEGQQAGKEIHPDAAGQPALVAPPAPTLASAQTALQADVDAQAEAQRARYITAGSGQAMVYLQKQSQAIAALQAAAATPPMAADAGQAAFILLAAEIGITVDPSTEAPAVDVFGVARAVVATVQAWLPLGAAIEAERLRTKATIAAATTVEAAQAAYAAIAWPNPA